MIVDLRATSPGLRDRILEESGEIRRFINIYVNQEDIRFLDGEQNVGEVRRRGGHRARDRGGRGQRQAPGRSARDAPRGRAGDLRRSARRRAVRALVLRALTAETPPAGRIVVVGAGKASGAMAAAVENAWASGSPPGSSS